MIEPKEEQSFTFNSPMRPALVNFDYHGTLIKQLTFDKPTDDLAYQLAHDEDVLGRIWALGQLATRLKNDATTAPERSSASLVGTTRRCFAMQSRSASSTR